MLKSLGIKVVLSLLIAVSLASDSVAQTRISFGRGRSSATLRGTVSSGGMRTYLLGVRAGQIITVQINSANNRVEGDIDYPNGDHLDNTDRGFWQGETTERGSYRINVINDGNRASSYSLTVTVR